MVWWSEISWIVYLKLVQADVSDTVKLLSIFLTIIERQKKYIPY